MIFAAASTSTGELTLEPAAGRRMWTAMEAGAGHEFERLPGHSAVGTRDGVGRAGSLGNGGGRDGVHVELLAGVAECIQVIVIVPLDLINQVVPAAQRPTGAPLL